MLTMTPGGQSFDLLWQAVDLRRIIDSTPALIHTARPDGYLDFFNQRWLEFIGVSPTNLLGWAWTAFIHSEDVEAFVEKWRTAIATGETFQGESRVRSADGQYRWMIHQKVPLRDQDGAILKWFGSSIDIEDRKRAEEQLRRQETELRQVLDLAPQLVAVFGRRRERLYANRMILDYLGITLEEWRQGSFGRVVHPDDSKRLNAYTNRAVSSGSGFESELRLRKGDGSYRWFLARYNPLRDEKGQVVRWYAASTDIEDRKRAEGSLQQALDEIKKLKDDLHRENIALREEIDKTSMFEEIVGVSPALTAVLARVAKVAPAESTVLITGETGTGKELIARAIHRRSRRASRPFVAVNCAAVPRDLIASELFGHEKGAFTGATQRRLGRLEMAEGGTIFLDEIGELPS
ncbi:MAG: sigma 54-interacting transcriptional regulator, partial [Silvibacterium sp.]